MFIDTHAHLDLVLNLESENLEKKDISNRLSDILNNNLEKIIHISLDPFEYEKYISFLNHFPELFYATGIYPDRITSPDYDEHIYIKKLRSILSTSKQVAIGEAGIDLKYPQYGSIEAQKSLFRSQLELAEELHYPIIIHSRESFYECYHVLKDFPKVQAVFHCFSYGVKEADLLLSRGDYLSFTGNLTYKKAANIKEAALITPLDRIFFETDSPYLSPEPYRGKPNTPANVQYTYLYFASIKEITMEDLCRQIQNNFYQFFKT